MASALVRDVLLEKQGQYPESAVDLAAAHDLAGRVLQGLEDASLLPVLPPQPVEPSLAPSKPLRSLAQPAPLLSDRQLDAAVHMAINDTADLLDGLAGLNASSSRLRRRPLDDTERSEARALAQQVLHGLEPEMKAPMAMPARLPSVPAASFSPALSRGLPTPLSSELLSPAPPQSLLEDDLLVNNWMAASTIKAQRARAPAGRRVSAELGSPGQSSWNCFEDVTQDATCPGHSTPVETAVPGAQFCRLSLHGHHGHSAVAEAVPPLAAFLCWARRREAPEAAVEVATGLPPLPRGGLVSSADAMMELLKLVSEEARSAGSNFHSDGMMVAGSLLLCSASSVDALELKLKRLMIPFASHSAKHRLNARTQLVRPPVVVSTYGLLVAREALVPIETRLVDLGGGWRTKRGELGEVDRQRFSLLHTVRWRRIIFFEADNLQNRMSQRAQAAGRLCAEIRWLVTSEAVSEGGSARKPQALVAAVFGAVSPQLEQRCEKHWRRLAYGGEPSEPSAKSPGEIGSKLRVSECSGGNATAE